jgi:hypothetical protein
MADLLVVLQKDLSLVLNAFSILCKHFPAFPVLYRMISVISRLFRLLLKGKTLYKNDFP